VISLAFAPDGRPLASGASAIGRSSSGTSPRAGRDGGWACRRARVSYLALSPDGRWLASTGDVERPVRLWDLEGRREDRLIESHSQSSEPVAFSPDGRLLAAAGDDGAVRLWDLATREELRRVGGPRDWLTGVAFSPDGRTLAATGTDADIRLWDLGELLKPRAGR
jgi:WD40 repeat protein